MFSKKKSSPKLDLEQREMYEYARKRTIQKRRLFQHFVVFLVGAVLLIIINVVIGYREEWKPFGQNWFVWAILIWSLLFFVHLLNVMVINSFMGKEWEQKHIERLVRKQKDRIENLQLEVEKDHPLPTHNTRYNLPEERKGAQRNDPDFPLNH